MAVAFDQISEHVTNGQQNPSWTHTPVGTPSGVLVFVFKSRPASISSVTYGGTTLDLIGSEQFGTGNSFLNIYGLSTGVPTGAQTVQVNASSSSFFQFSHCVTFTGSLDTATESNAFTSFQSAEAGAGASSVSTLTVTSQVGDLVIDKIIVSTDPGTDKAMAPGADQTERIESFEAVFGENNAAVSTQPGAASVAMDYTWGTGTNVGFVVYAAVNVVQAAAGGGTTRGTPFGARGTALNGGRTFQGILR